MYSSTRLRSTLPSNIEPEGLRVVGQHYSPLESTSPASRFMYWDNHPLLLSRSAGPTPSAAGCGVETTLSERRLDRGGRRRSTTRDGATTQSWPTRSNGPQPSSSAIAHDVTDEQVDGVVDRSAPGALRDE